ncbi:MAG: hypothetical protein HY429_03000 [Candidatus Levybacteria bacterium]|nr:hypothetical protein [Candidatus Levybacteria bacterium]
MKNSKLLASLELWRSGQCKIQKFEETLHSWQSQAGSALVTLLFFSVIAAIITSSATIIILINAQGANTLEQGMNALSIAESGAENAYLRLIRDTTYTGESVALDGGTAVIQVTGTNPKVIRSQGTIGLYTHIVEVEVQITNNEYTISSWKEVY